MILHLKNKILSMHHKIEIFDENEELVYEVASKAISIHDKTVITNAQKEEVANIHRKVLSIHERYYVDMSDGTSFEMKTEILHIVKEVIDIEALGWKILGNFLEHDYRIEDANGNLLASAHKKWMAVHEKYAIDIQDESQVDLIVAVYVVLEHILTMREANETSTMNANVNTNTTTN
ncbi:MAG: LURP-one-related family protein [Lachnospiraceae bacterium]|jgi:uncharacterized protein YxjI|nr:LURP-one-related family protein [Lachnospiraceae bacterium]MDD3617617.1 LURP-one-related family protein [Lachnospiraceae bacterium]